MKYLFSLLFILSITILIVLFNHNAEQPNTTSAAFALSSEEHKNKMHHIIECASLIANVSRINKHDFSAGSEAFQQVTYSLGQAEAHAIDAGLNSRLVKSMYDKRTLHYYVLLANNPQRLKQDLASEIEQCQQQLRLYNPKTQMQAVMEQAQELGTQ